MDKNYQVNNEGDVELSLDGGIQLLGGIVLMSAEGGESSECNCREWEVLDSAEAGKVYRLLDRNTVLSSNFCRAGFWQDHEPSYYAAQGITLAYYPSSHWLTASRSMLYVTKNTSASGITIESGAVLYVQGGGVADGIVVQAGGTASLHIGEDAVMRNISLDYGAMGHYGDGVATISEMRSLRNSNGNIYEAVTGAINNYHMLDHFVNDYMFDMYIIGGAVYKSTISTYTLDVTDGTLMESTLGVRHITVVNTQLSNIKMVGTPASGTITASNCQITDLLLGSNTYLHMSGGVAGDIIIGGAGVQLFAGAGVGSIKGKGNIFVDTNCTVGKVEFDDYGILSLSADAQAGNVNITMNSSIRMDYTSNIGTITVSDKNYNKAPIHRLVMVTGNDIPDNYTLDINIPIKFLPFLKTRVSKSDDIIKSIEWYIDLRGGDISFGAECYEYGESVNYVLPDDALMDLLNVSVDYTLTEGPDWMEINERTGNLSGNAEAGSYEVLVNGKNELGATTTHVANILVLPENIPGVDPESVSLFAQALKILFTTNNCYSVSLPDFEVKLLGKGFSMTNMKVSLTVAGDYQLKLNGKLEWQLSGAQSGTGLNNKLSIDLSGEDKFIVINVKKDFSEASLEFSGEIKVPDFSIAGFGFSRMLLAVKKEGVGEDASYSVTVGGYITLPFMSYAIGGEIGVSNGALDTFVLGVDNLNAPIFNTGIFLQGVSGGVRNLTTPENAQLEGSFRMTFGPQITVNWGLPSWMGVDDGVYSVAEMNVTGALTVNGLKGEVDITVLAGLASGSGTATYDSNGFSIKGNFTMLGGAVTVNGELKNNGDSGITVSGQGSIKVPNRLIFGPFYGRTLSGGVLLNYNSSHPNSSNSITIWQRQDALGWNLNYGLKIKLDGSVTILGGKEVDKLASGQRMGRSTIYTESWSVETGETILFSMAWESGDANWFLTGPDGSIYDLAAIIAHDDITIISDANAENQITVAVRNSVAGTWTMTTNGVSGVEFSAVSLAAPVVPPVIDSIVLASNGRAVTFHYSVDGSLAPGAQIMIFCDESNSDYEGRLVASGDVLGIGGSLSWRLDPEYAGGAYYFYAIVVSDEITPAFSEYYGSAIQFVDLDITAPQKPFSLESSSANGETQLSWAAPWDEVGVVGYRVVYSSQIDFYTSTTVETENNSLSLRELAHGKYYFRVAAYDNAGNLSEWSQIGNFDFSDANNPDVADDILRDLDAGEVASGCRLYNGSVTIVGATVYDIAISGGVLWGYGGVISGVEINSGGNLYLYQRTIAEACVLSGGSMSIDAGVSASDILISSGILQVNDDGWADDITILSGGLLRITDGSVTGNITVESGGVISAINQHQNGVAQLAFAGSVTLYGTLDNDVVINADNNAITIVLAGRNLGEQPAITHLVNIRKGDFYLKIADDCTPGEYQIASGAGTFSGSFTVVTSGGNTIGVVSRAQELIIYDEQTGLNTIYSLTGRDMISLSIRETDGRAPTIPSLPDASVNERNVTLSWGGATDESGIAGYEYRYGARADFAGVSPIYTVNLNANLRNLMNGTYYWQVRALDNSGNIGEWSAVADFAITTSAGYFEYADVIFSAYGSALEVHSGENASGVVIEAGELIVHSGGRAIMTTIRPGGLYNLHSGGTAGNTVMIGGTQNVYGLDSKTTLHDSQFSIQNVYSGGTALYATIDRGAQYVYSGGVAKETLLGSIAIQFVYTSGVISGGVVSGSQHVLGGIAYDVEVYGSGIQDLGFRSSSVDGVASNTVLSDGGRQLLSGNGSAFNTLIGEGGTVSQRGGLLTGASITSGGKLVIEGGAARAYNIEQDVGGNIDFCIYGAADATAVISGTNGSGLVFGYMNGVAVNFQLYQDGYLRFDRGKTVNTEIYSGGVEYLESSASGENGRIYSSGSQVVMDGARAINTIIYDGGVQEISYNAVASNTVVSGGLQQLLNYGSVVSTVLSSGGTLGVAGANNSTFADNIIISSGGELCLGGRLYQEGFFLLSTGSATNIRLESGGKLLLASNTNCYAGNVIQAEGGIIITDAASRTVIFGSNSKGEFSLSGGIASNFILYDGASQTVFSQSYNCEVHSGAVLTGSQTYEMVYFENLTIHSGGTFIAKGNLQFDGVTRIGGRAEFINGYAFVSDVELLLADRSAEDDLLIDSISSLSGLTSVTISIDSANQELGVYSLAGNAGDFNLTTTLNAGGMILSDTFAIGSTVSHLGRDYTLELSNDILQLVISSNVDYVLPDTFNITYLAGDPAFGIGGDIFARFIGSNDYSHVVYGGGTGNFAGGVKLNFENPEIFGRVVAGGQGGNVGSTELNFFNRTTISGYIFGGGENSLVVGDTLINGNGGTVNNLVGGNLANAPGIYTNSDVKMNLDHAFKALKSNSYVFGGGMATTSGAGSHVENVSINASGASLANLHGGGYALNGGVADVDSVTILATGAGFSGYLYAGARAESSATASVGAVDLTLDGGAYTHVFGGGYATLGGTSTVGSVNICVNGGIFNGTIYGGGHAGSGAGVATVDTVNIRIDLSQNTVNFKAGSGITVGGNKLSVVTGNTALTLTGQGSNLQTAGGVFEGWLNAGSLSCGTDGSQLHILRFTDFTDNKFNARIQGFNHLELAGDTVINIVRGIGWSDGIDYSFDLAGRDSGLAGTAMMSQAGGNLGITGDTRFFVNLESANLASGNSGSWYLLDGINGVPWDLDEALVTLSFDNGLTKEVGTGFFNDVALRVAGYDFSLTYTQSTGLFALNWELVG